jgi:DNA-binding XRE family transcriptional regulator/plasmid maintenance system killer protein
VQKKYEMWKDIVRASGPFGLAAVPGLHDEALSGRWCGYRSSRLNQQWRVIYKVLGSQFVVDVVRITPHDYRRSPMARSPKREPQLYIGRRPVYVARPRIRIRSGDTVRMLRELHDWTQAELARRVKMSPAAVSAIEANRKPIGSQRAMRFAKVLHVHPAVILFPQH